MDVLVIGIIDNVVGISCDRDVKVIIIKEEIIVIDFILEIFSLI